MAAGCGLALAGVAAASPLENLRPRLEQRRREGRTTIFEETRIDRRLDPKMVWPAVQSLVVVGDSYLPPSVEQFTPGPDAGPRGKVARCAQGLDYHRQLEIKTRNLAAELQKRLSSPLGYRLMIDRVP